MERKTDPREPFRVGDWLVRPDDGSLSAGHSLRRLEPQVMDLLVFLAARSGEVVSRQQILDEIWRGRFVSEDALTGSISQIRKALGDEARVPRYVETVPKRGYRLLVAKEPADAPPPTGVAPRGPRPGRRAGMVIAVLAIAVGLGVWRLSQHVSGTPVTSLAVLPLKNLSADPRNAYLAEGVTAALTTELAKLAPLRVVSQTSAARYGDSTKRLPEIAHELQVDALLEGSVAYDGRRVRIDAQLIDARRDAHLWAESYEGDLADLFHVQTEIAQSVARAIRLRLAPGAAARSPSKTGVPVEAMKLYLRGRAALDLRTVEAIKQAQVYFRQATEVDPQLAEAFSGLADSQVGMVYGGLAPFGETAPEAREAALRALALDPSSAEAHASYGTVLAFLDLDTAGAERELRRAVELQPGLQGAQRGYAVLLMVLGRHDEAIDHARRALALDPMSVAAHVDLAYVLLAARRFDAAVQQLNAALAVDPASGGVHDTLASAYWFQRKWAEGYAAHRRAIQLYGVTDEAIAYLDGVFRREGLRGVCRVEAEYQAGQAVQNPSTRMETAIDYAWAGELDRAFRILEQHYESLRPALILFAGTPFLDPLRSDPRFARLVERARRPRPAPSASPARP
jgi:TolB-like protein/DNA-binding winged helix-turn-helix (wHTH) protein